MKTPYGFFVTGISLVFVLNSLVRAGYTSNLEEFTYSQELKHEGEGAHSDLPSKTYLLSRLMHQSDNAQHKRIETDANLIELGRRSWRVPFFIRNFQPPSDPSTVNRRRSQPLSVTGPLSSLANMLAAEGRRRQQHESVNNRMRLLELGKRSLDLAKSANDLDTEAHESTLNLNLLSYQVE